MKTSGIILIICLLSILSVSGQTILSEKQDSLPNEVIKPQKNQLDNPLNSKEQFRQKDLKMAFIEPPKKGNSVSPVDRMRIYNQPFYSRMPVFKPDTSIKYHLLIKRITKAD